MRKIKLKKRIKKLKIIVIIIFISFVCSIYLIELTNKKIAPQVFDYAEIEAKKISNIIINDAISKTIAQKSTPDSIFETKEDSSGEIKAIDFNTININKYLSETTKYIQQDLVDLEKGKIDKKNIFKGYKEEDLKRGIIGYANSSLIFKNPIFSNLGPKIPIKISLAGDIVSYISAEVNSYGINSSLIKVFVNVKITEKMIIPFLNKNIDMEAKVPIAMKIVNGIVPEYYFGNTESKKIITPR